MHNINSTDVDVSELTNGVKVIAKDIGSVIANIAVEVLGGATGDVTIKVNETEVTYTQWKINRNFFGHILESILQG